MTPEERAKLVKGSFLPDPDLCLKLQSNIAAAIRAAVQERTDELWPLIADPRALSGWDDPDVPPDAAEFLAKLAKLKGIEVPPHIAEAAREAEK